MRFADIPGNDILKKTMVAMADSGRVGHAMLLYENEGCGALPLALAYVQYLNCRNRHDGDSCGECQSCRQMAGLVHPDTHFVFPVNSSRKVDVQKPVSESFLPLWRELVHENPYFLESDLYARLGIEGKAGNIAIAEARYILEKLSLSSVEDGYKTVLLWLPERMNAETANKLLKIVEEPPEKTLFIFVTHHPDRVLQTIFSRCQSYRVLPLDRDVLEKALVENFGKDPQESERQAAICGGSIGVALDAMGEREEYSAFMQIFRDLVSGLAARDLQAVLDASDSMSAIDSREKQKAFCIFAGECLRKIFMLQQNMQELAGIAPEEAAFWTGVAAGPGRTFSRKALALADRAVMLLDRNVNPKMVFCDMVGQMYLLWAR